MRAPVELCVVAGVSWLAGLLGSVVLRFAVFHETPGVDLVFVAGWSAALFAISVVAAYVPALFVLSRLIRPLPWWVAGFCGLALSLLPLGILRWTWEGRFRVSLTGSAAIIFLPVFAIAGVAFAVGCLDRSVLPQRGGEIETGRAPGR
jgi:hypothetical protein